MYRRLFNVAGLPGERSREGCGQNFSNIIDELELKDLPIRTLYVVGVLENLRRARLDKFLILDDLDSYFGVVFAEAFIRSFPNLLGAGSLERGPLPFRFENLWLKERGPSNLLKDW